MLQLNFLPALILLIGLASVKLSSNFVRITVGALLGFSLSACTSDVVDPNNSADMGSAEPIASPPAESPAGQIIDFQPIQDIDITNNLIGVRTADALHIGTLQDFEQGTALKHALEPTCNDVSANAGKFVLGCGDEIRIYEQQALETISTPHTTTSATITTTGEVLAASDGENSVWLFIDGQLEDEFSVARETDQIEAVPNPGSTDSVVRTNRFDTTIQDLAWNAGKQGGTLRVGLGVGKIAAAENGLVLAADATGEQLLVYTTDDIIRLQQSAPVNSGPWDVTWDERNKLAWVSSTATNTASAYDISQGVPLQRSQLRTVADAQSIASLSDGTLILGSATGDGLQIVPPEQN